MILLSFDTEEFDLPREHGVEVDTQTSMMVSRYGTERILDILKNNNVLATFFISGKFAELAPDIVKRIMNEGHEVACHGLDHFQPSKTDFKASKKIVESIAGVKTFGYRQPRMFPVSEKEIKEAGYLYNSSLNPAFIPGRYMNLNTPRSCFMKDGVLQIPASVTPLIRFPLFWLSNHVLPRKLYYWMIKRTLKHDGYFNTYMHPWEFFELKEHPEWKTQSIILMNSGRKLQLRLDLLIKELKKTGIPFSTYREFAKIKLEKLSNRGAMCNNLHLL